MYAVTGVEQLQSTEKTTFSLAKTTGLIMAAVFVASFVFLAIMSLLGVVAKSVMVWLFGAVMIATMVGPAVYLLILYPLHRALVASQTPSAPPSAAEPRHPVHLDPMTQVLNQRAIVVDLLEAVAHSERYGNPLTIAKVDIDHLAQINERHGQGGGDAMLKMVASSLSEALRMPDRVGRYGDQEFLVVLPETEASGAHTIADRIRDQVSATSVTGKNGEFTATISIGLTEFRRGDDLEQILSRVDVAIKQAKDKGSNLVVVN